MKKLTLIALILFTTIFITNAEAEIMSNADFATGTSGELLVKGSRAFSEKGLYRIDDEGSGYHLYIITTTTTTQIHAVPIRKD